jgi:required for meiotic nuclear division protein 1
MIWVKRVMISSGTKLVIHKTAFAACAVYVGERIDLRSFAKSSRIISQQPVTLPVDGGGIVMLFRYGAAVFFDTAKADEAQFIGALGPLIEQPYQRPESEEISICISTDKKEGMEDGTAVLLKDTSVDRLQVVAAALGKSVALAQYETDVASTFDSIEPIAAELEKSGKVGRDARLLLRHIGRALQNEHKMVARVEVVERPDLLWDHPEFEQLYDRLEDEFELSERAAILDSKLELISRTVSTTLDLLQTQRGLRVEWYILGLIVFEIFLSLYELFTRSR